MATGSVLCVPVLIGQLEGPLANKIMFWSPNSYLAVDCFFFGILLNNVFCVDENTYECSAFVCGNNPLLLQ